ncbi:MAG: glycosyltransferase family 4 protein [Sarcina sp.]
MKKVLYVANISRTVNNFFIPHMNMLIENGYSVDVACNMMEGHELDKSRMNPAIREINVPFTRSPLSPGNFAAFVKLYKLQKKNNYDIIHVHTPIVSFYTRLLKLFFKNVKMIYTAHGYHFFKGSSKLSWIVFYTAEKFMSKYTDVLININDEDFEVSKNFHAKKLIKMNGVGVETNRYSAEEFGDRIKIREEFGIKNEDFVFIMVGEHNKNKNQIELIKAMENIKDKYPHIKSIIIGDGELLEENKKYVKDKNLTNCNILGFRRDVGRLMYISDVLVSLSYREGLPRNLIEGLAAGKAIIATNIRGSKELVSNNENGYLVEPGDINDLEEKIVKLYQMDKNELQDFSKNSLEKFKSYEMGNILKELLAIYEDQVK